MHTTHLPDVHSLKSPDLFLYSVGEIIWFSTALFFFLVSWAVGGPDFKDSIGGNIVLSLLVVALVISAIMSIVTRPED